MKSLILNLLLVMVFLIVAISMLMPPPGYRPALASGGRWRSLKESAKVGVFAGLVLATVLTSAGKAIVTNRIIGSGTEPVYVAMGTGAGTAAVGDTTLFTEVETRTSGTSSRVTTTVTNDTYQVVGTVTATTTRAITNAGNFDASSSGNLFVKGDFSTINLANGDAIQFTVKLQFT